MKTRTKVWLGILLSLAVVAVTGWYIGKYPMPVIHPAGQIGTKERNLMAFTAAASLAVVTPVFILMGVFAWKYREGAKKPAKYHPDEEGNWKLEAVWWLIPTALMVVISTITWRSSYALDPFRPLSSSQKTLHVQVVAMDWKWLFIYPDQKVASVNVAPIPVNTPVEFDITSDTVMSSFWVPSLGGQMYAMPGMSTKLNLEAAKSGTYNGSSANIAGKGFADMKFQVLADDNDGFNSWIHGMQHRTTTRLDADAYAKLAKPGMQARATYYSSVDSQLYDTIVMKYMMPMGDGGENVGVTGITK
jgi:cytochrome o ubiquinol oxidase subunit 2